MEIGVISNIYLLIFFPLFASLTCQIFPNKNFCFNITIFSFLLIFALILKIFPDVLIYEKIASDFELSIVSLALEFSLDLLGIIILSIIIFLEFLVIIFFKKDIDVILNSRHHANFYSVFLLKIFSLIALILANNLFNLFFFIEIYSFAFFSIATISFNKKLLNISFQNFCLSTCSSLLILICFFSIYLIFGELNFEKIADNLFLLPATNFWIMIDILILISIAFIFKFFPIWQYFQKIKSPSVIASFIIIDAFFIKILLGIYLVMKFIYFFFGHNFLFTQYQFANLMVFSGFILIIYSSLKLLKEHHLKVICAYFSINNLGFIISAIGMQTVESMQALFFFLLNFSLVNFFIFLYASFQKNIFKTSSLKALYHIMKHNPLVAIPIKFVVIFIAGLPFTFLFFGYFYIGLASFKIGINLMMILALIFSNFVHFRIAVRIINSAGSKNLIKVDESVKIENNFYQIFVFWILIVAIYINVFSAGAVNNLASRFAVFLLSNSI